MSAGRNFLINLAGNLLGLVLFAVLTPVYLHAIGAERYGVVTVILSLSMYVSTFNFGMGPALTYHVAGALKDDLAGQSEAYWSAMAMTMPIGLVASFLLFGLLPLGLADVMHLTPAVRAELGGAVTPLVGIGICTILLGNVRGMWNGRQAFLTLAAFSSTDTVLAILIPVLAALYISNAIGTLLYATFAARLSMLLLGMALSSFHMLAGHWPRASLRRMRAMLGYGGWVTLSTLVETVVSSADRLLLGSLSGAAQITWYSIPLSVTSRSMILPLSLLGSVFPKFVGAQGEREARLLSKTLRFLLLLTPGYALVVAVAAPLLRYWISAQFAAQATWPLQVLAIAMWVEAISAIYYYQLNARGDVRANFLVVFGVIAPYLGMLAAGAWFWGATGVALAYLARNLMLFTGRTYLARVQARDLRVIAINAAPLVLAILLSAHDWQSVTRGAIALSAAAPLVSCGACLWTRPHDLQEMLSALLPGRFTPRRATRIPPLAQ